MRRKPSAETAIRDRIRTLVCMALLNPVLLFAADTQGAGAMGGPDLRTIPRAARHALIIGIGEYVAPGIPALRGVKHDMDSAAKMATAMSIPPENIRYIRDRDATAAQIEKEIVELNTRTQPGDRVFLYYSGHGSRWYDAAVKQDGCVEALMASDAKPLTNQRIASLLKPISDKTDKLLVFYDACHSGGIASQPLMTRALNFGADKLTPKFTATGAPELCAHPVNIKTRDFAQATQRLGGLPQNFVQISSSRPDEISFDDEKGGGLATQAWRDCMLGEAQDLDGSGAVSVDEIAVCVQAKLDKRFSGSSQYAAPHVTLGGNKSFIPAWFAASPPMLQDVPEALPQAAVQAPARPPASTPVTAPIVVAAPAPASHTVSANAALADIFAQRDARRQVTLRASPKILRIGKDVLDFSVTSSREGFVYMVLLGSDGKSFYMLFPNDIDRDNAIKAGETLKLPRKDWKIMAQGPAGRDRVLVVVSESPRDLSLLGEARTGPFLQTLTDQRGRANLQWLLGTSINLTSADCARGGQRNLAVAKNCSDAFGAALIEIKEK